MPPPLRLAVEAAAAVVDANIPRRVRALAVLWPAFMMAGVLEALVFAVVDPSQLQGPGGVPLDVSPSAVYTLAFLVFWAVIALASGLTQWLGQTADDVNQGPLRRSAPHWPR